MPNLKIAGLVSAMASLVFFSGPAAQAGDKAYYKMPATKQGTFKSGPITPTPNKNNTEKINKIHIPNSGAASENLGSIMAKDKAVNDAKAKERQLLDQTNRDASQLKAGVQAGGAPATATAIQLEESITEVNPTPKPKVYVPETRTK